MTNTCKLRWRGILAANKRNRKEWFRLSNAALIGRCYDLEWARHCRTFFHRIDARRGYVWLP